MRRSKRRASPLQTLSVLAVSGLFFFIALAGLYKCFSKEPELKEEVPAVQADPDSASEPRNGAAAAASLSGERKKRFYTILIGGLDDENGGSDTNILAAVDAEGGSINAVSLPRDTLLNVTWSVKKLNNAYHHGGISSTIEQISNLLGIPVDYYITVDLRAFVELVDAIEGVDFDIPVDMDYDDPVQDLHIHFAKGPRHLTGQEALEVVRWRQNNDGSGYPTADIGRISTQQEFLKAVAAQTLQLGNWDKIPALAKIFQQNVETDLELSNLVWLGEQALTMGTANIHFHTLPGDGAGWYKGGSYYVLEPEAVLELINASFNPYQRPLTLDDMDILVP